MRRRGLAADLPMFIPGFGAYSYGVTAYFITLVAVLGYLSTLAPLGAHTR